MRRKDFLAAPVLWCVLVAILLVVWVAVDPATLVRNFDQGGYSPFELATIPLFLAIVPAVWWKCPFAGSRARRVAFCLAVTVVALMAVVKELDLHQALLHVLYPDFVTEGGSLAPGLVKPDGTALSGTPFKMRVLTNGGVPVGMKLVILAYFGAFFGVFVIGFAALAKNWLLGVFRFVPSAWAVGCFGVSGVVVQIADRLPAWLGHAHGLKKTVDGVTAAQSFCTAMEEGCEMLIAVFALLAVFMGHREKGDDAC